VQIEIQELENCKLRVKYEAGLEDITKKKEEVLEHFKKAPVPGCRPGKAPMSSIRLHYSNQIHDALKRALAEDAYHNTIFEKQLRAYGTPNVNSLLLDNNKFICEFDMSIKPSFELSDYKNMEIPKPHIQITSLELAQKMLQDLRVRYGTTEPFNDGDFVQNGDNVIINYECLIDGIRVEALCDKSKAMTVGASDLKAFDENILGMKPGESKEFDIAMPEDSLPSMAGKLGHFTLEFIMGSKNTPCALNDDLAKKVGEEDFNALNATVNTIAMSQVVKNEKSALNNAVVSRLVEDINMNVPSWLSLSEARYLATNSKLDWDTLVNLDKEAFISVAERNVKLSLILDRIREVEPEAQLSDQEVFDVVKQYIAKNNPVDKIDEVIQEMNKSGQLQILFARIKDENTIDFLTKTVKVIE